jgi:hypothetical protein
MMSDLLLSRRPSPGACLDDLLATRFLPRRWASRIWSARELPVPLENCVMHLAKDSEWRAYGEGGHIFFAVARAHSAAHGSSAYGAAAQSGDVAIDVYFLDDHAAVYSAGVWQYDPHQGWWLDAVIDASYDCESGWSAAGLREPSHAIEPPLEPLLPLPLLPPSVRASVRGRSAKPRRASP